jgi:hypothetical protein
MGLFDFLKPISQGFSSAAGGLKDALGPHVQAAPGAVMPGNFGGTAQPGAAAGLLGGGGDDGLQTAGVGRAAPLGDVGPIQQAPQLTQQPGLLDRLGTPDERGLSFGDKLFAAGSIAQGDSQGAYSMIQQARAAHRQQQQEDEAKRVKANRSAAFKAAIDPVTGRFNPGIYAQMAGEDFDPQDAAQARTAFKKDGAFMNANNGIYHVSEDDPAHPTTVVAGAPKPPGQFVQDPETGEWGINPLYAQLQEDIARARRRGAPPVGRSGGRGGAGRAPKSYGQNDVEWQ